MVKPLFLKELDVSFQCFIDDGGEKVYEDIELKSVCNEDSCQSQGIVMTESVRR